MNGKVVDSCLSALKLALSLILLSGTTNIIGCQQPETRPTASAEPVQDTTSLTTALADAASSAAGSSTSSSSSTTAAVTNPRAQRLAWNDHPRWPGSFAEQNKLLFDQLAQTHRLSAAQLAAMRRVFAQARYLGQGNPTVTEHPVTVAQCQRQWQQQDLKSEKERFHQICGAPHMAPLYDPQTAAAKDARACIDQFEFPNIPCTYPVTWVRANEAAELCHIMGKRLCDAHEWEGACAGRVEPPDYDFATVRNMQPRNAVALLRALHNSRIINDKRWAYGREHRKGVCGTGSRKSKTCTAVGWATCGTNTYPSGSFVKCRSPLGVYDQHGNVAEHMNLPLKPSQMASKSIREYGVTEMKGSWFVFDLIHAHHDHCRWRAPYWHGSRVLHVGSHHNYHLGFRCCKSL